MPYLLQARDENLNEADTVRRLVKCFEEVFGYNGMSEVTQELEVKEKYCDLAIKINGAVKLLIEAKAGGIVLRDRHIEQAERYAAESNIKWVLLTNGVTCEKCQKVTPHYRITGRLCYSCEHCGTQVYPMAGTIFERSSTPLRLWFKAIAYMAVTRCGISSRQLSRDLGVGVKTGWRMFTQIRKILAENPTGLGGGVEVDETYIGGRKKGKQGRGSENKVIVFGMVERGGRVRAQVVPDVKAKTLLPKIEERILPDAMVYTDDLRSYNKLTSMGFVHGVVNHSAGVYVTGEDIHTNTVEGFWSQLKRSIDGTYHHVEGKYLQGYVDEYAFRYSHRKDKQAMFRTMLEKVAEKAS